MDAFIIDACRTPRGIGKAGKGALSGLHPQQLAATVLKAIAQRNGIDTADVADVIWGTSAQVGAQCGELGRMATLDAGYDIRSSGVTLDRYCGPGIAAVALAAAQVMSGMEDLVVAGGTEMMSMPRNRGGDGPPMMDSGKLRLCAKHPQSQQGACADAIAGVHFAKSLVPVFRDDGSPALDRDEYPRPGTTAEALAALEPVFAAMADFQIGAAAVRLASADDAKHHGLKPRARVVATANIGDCPTLMLNAPVPAKAGLTLDDIDLFEINEAFAVVAEKFIRALKLDRAKVNVDGGMAPAIIIERV